MSSLPPFAMVIPLPEDARLRSVDVAVWYALSVSARWEKDDEGRPYLGRCASCGLKRLCELARCGKTALLSSLVRLEAAGALIRARSHEGEAWGRTSYILMGGCPRDGLVRETDKGSPRDGLGLSVSRPRVGRQTDKGCPPDGQGVVRQTDNIQSINTNCSTKRNTDFFTTSSTNGRSPFLADRPRAGGGEKIDLQGGEKDKAGGEPDAAFETFWAVYPRKVQKQVAGKAWKAAIKAGARAADIQDAAGAYSDAMTKKRTPPDKVMYAGTFLGDERWRDWLPPDGAAYAEIVRGRAPAPIMSYAEAIAHYKRTGPLTSKFYSGALDVEAKEAR